MHSGEPNSPADFGRVLRRRLRDSPRLRAAIVPSLALRVRPDVTSNWLAVAMYHDMPAGAESRFAKQLAAMRNFGDFIGLDDALALLRRDRAVAGRHICVTFDDGHAGVLHHAMPILQRLGVPSAHFVVPAWIGEPGRLTWDECRRLLAMGCVVGSHSLTHARLAELEDAQAAYEITYSRAQIEAELGAPCVHFACPWGQPGGGLPRRPRAGAGEGCGLPLVSHDHSRPRSRQHRPVRHSAHPA